MRQAWIVAAALAAAPGVAVPLLDGDGGASCHFFDSGARLAWGRPGGDWVDAQLKPYGDTPFAAADVAAIAVEQLLEWELTSLATLWNDGRALPGAVYLRKLPTAQTGTVDFGSREGANPATLVVKWDDGQSQRLAPVADTFFACPTHKTLGEQALLKVGPGQQALVVFPFEPRAGRKVVSMRLLMTSPKQSGKGSRIGVFAPQLPGAAHSAAPAPGLSDARERDAGLATDPAVLYVQRFEDDSWREIAASDPNTKDSLRTVEADRQARFEPLDGRALAVTIRRGTRQALNHHIRFAGLPGGEPDAAHFRYHLRLADNWDPLIDGGKLPGFAGTYNRAGWGMRKVDGTNGWSVRGAFMQTSADDGPDSAWRAIGSYAYTATTEGASGEVWGWNLGPTGRLQKNRWYAVEQYIELNTPGQPDGRLRVWIDGQLAFDRSGLLFRTVPTLKVESVWLNVYHGGVAKADRDLTLYIDNLVVARRYIGPGRFPR